MISPISFTSTYKVSDHDNIKLYKFQQFALDKESEMGVKAISSGKFIKRANSATYDYKPEQTLIVPDYMDCDVEKFCANNCISYTKYDTKDLLDPKHIAARIACPKGGYRVVQVDAKKLEELAQNQESNFEHCRSDYDKYYTDSVDTMFRKNREVPASTLVINNPSGNKNLWRYVNVYGVNRLNDEQVMFDFVQKTDDPDHCVYFALKDMGLEKIPVYVDSQSYEAGKILGLF